MKLNDVLKFKIKKETWESLNLEGENSFTKIKDVTGDSKRVRKYGNKDLLTVLPFEKVEKLWKENKVIIIQGDLDEG